MSIQNRRRLPLTRKHRHIGIAAAFAALFALYAPVANAGDLFGGIHGLFAHHQAGTVYRASDYVRTPHRNYAPAIVASYAMTTATSFAPYEPYTSGGSVVINTPITKAKHHGAKFVKHASKAKPVAHKMKPRHKKARKYVRLKGVNQKVYSCTGYASRPESFSCVEKSSRYIPRKGPWIALSDITHSQ